MGTKHVKATEREYQYFSEHKGEPGVPIVYQGGWLDPTELETWRRAQPAFPPAEPPEGGWPQGVHTPGEVTAIDGGTAK